MKCPRHLGHSRHFSSCPSCLTPDLAPPGPTLVPLFLGWPRLWAAAGKKAQSLEELPDPTALSSVCARPPPPPRGWVFLCISVSICFFLFSSLFPSFPFPFSRSLSLPFLTFSVVSVPFSQSLCLPELCFFVLSEFELCLAKDLGVSPEVTPGLTY